jgi:hypothetical protein
MRRPLPVSLWEDYQAWEKYGNTEHRWVFNKLEVALRGGLHAGPAAVAPSHRGLYISRPVYNIYGMGIGAEQFYYSEEEYEEFVNYKTVPPGFFWCEWLNGPQLSIDYQRYDDGTWGVSSVWEGHHYSDSNLTKFSSWTRLSNRAGIPVHELPIDINWTLEKDLTFFNVESRSGHIVEIHLRPGDLMFNDLPVGTTLIPVWQGQDTPRGEWVEDTDPEMLKYEAHGHLREIRDGFIVVPNRHQ